VLKEEEKGETVTVPFCFLSKGKRDLKKRQIELPPPDPSLSSASRKERTVRKKKKEKKVCPPFRFFGAQEAVLRARKREMS